MRNNRVPDYNIRLGLGLARIQSSRLGPYWALISWNLIKVVAITN